MRCSKCGSDNPADKNFCADCGARLANHCPKCRAENPPSKRFCGDCGAPPRETAGEVFLIARPELRTAAALAANRAEAVELQLIAPFATPWRCFGPLEKQWARMR